MAPKHDVSGRSAYNFDAVKIATCRWGHGLHFEAALLRLGDRLCRPLAVTSEWHAGIVYKSFWIGRL